jgi:hypothetical protein
MQLSDIDTAVVGSLRAVDPSRLIREAGIAILAPFISYWCATAIIDLHGRGKGGQR